jgi:hypothetical protein
MTSCWPTRPPACMQRSMAPSCRQRHEGNQSAIARFGEVLRENGPDVVLIVGDDDKEVLGEDKMPSISFNHHGPLSGFYRSIGEEGTYHVFRAAMTDDDGVPVALEDTPGRSMCRIAPSLTPSAAAARRSAIRRPICRRCVSSIESSAS